MLRTIRFAVAALMTAALVGLSAPAFAAPLGWQSVDVTQQTEQQQSMLLVSGELPKDAKLPYETELALPAGTQLQWIGEILGGAPEKDPALTYTKSTVQGMDVYRFTLTKSRTAQVEGVVQGAGGFDGTNYTSTLKWTAWQAVPEVRVSQRIPKSAQIAQVAPGATVQAGSSGYSYYTKTVKDPKAGEALDLTFSYTLPAAGASGTGAGAGAGSDAVVLGIILIVAVGGFALLMMSVRRKMAAKATEDSATRTPRAKTSPAATSGSASKASGAAAKRQAAHEGNPEPPQAKKLNPVIPTVAVIGVLIVAFLIAGNRGTSVKALDGKITKSFGAASPCTNASIPVMANQGVDLAEQGAKLVDAFTGYEGVGDVTLDLARSTVDISFCASSQTEDSVRQILSGTGLVTLAASPAASAPASATLDPTGKKQTASVDTATGAFSPGKVVLKAGVPAEIAFGQASGCLTEVVVSQLSLKQDLTGGPATVSLPALEPGTYAFACGMGHQTGEFVVQ